MKFNVENLEEQNMVKLIVEASDEEFENGIQRAYIKEKNKISIQGFRKGKAPRNVIEKMYGKDVFYEGGANEILGELYEKAVEESGLDIVSNPKIEAVSLELGKPFVFSAEVATRPEATLGEYKGVKIEKIDTTVTDEDVDKEVDNVRHQNSRFVTVSDRAVEDKDTAIIDFEGFIDDVAFEGGKGENHELKIGSNSFIPGFEDQIIGKKTGEEFDVNVTFPEDYHAKELAGKPAVFKVKVNEIKCEELPEVDDDFASEVSEYDTMAEYKESLKKELAEKKEKAARDQKEDKVIEKIIEGATMHIPDAMVDTTVRNMAEEFAQRLQSQGLTLEQYFQFTGLTVDKLFEDLKPQAIKRIQSRTVLEAVVKAEGLTATEEDVQKELEDMAKAYKMEIEKLNEFIGEEEKDNIKKDVAIKKAVDFVVDSAVEE